jgi:hypothetical protein
MPCVKQNQHVKGTISGVLNLPKGLKQQKSCIHNLLQNLRPKLDARKIGYAGADVDRFLGINTSTVNRLVVSEDVSKEEK